MGDETRQITNKLEDVIRTIAVDVGKISTTQAIIQTKQEATYGTVGRIETQVNRINSRVNKLESWQDKFIGGGKVVGGLVVLVGIIFGAIKIWL